MFLGMRRPLCSHVAEKGPQVGKESDCMMDRSKQRDANSRFWFRTTDMASPKTSEPSSTWGYSASQCFTLYPRLQTFRAARKQCKKNLTKNFCCPALVADLTETSEWRLRKLPSFLLSFLHFLGEISHVKDPSVDKSKLVENRTTYRYPIFLVSFFIIVISPVLMDLISPPLDSIKL